MIAAGVFSKKEFNLIDEMEALAKQIVLRDAGLKFVDPEWEDPHTSPLELAKKFLQFVEALESGDSISAARIDWENSQGVTWETSNA